MRNEPDPLKFCSPLFESPVLDRLKKMDTDPEHRAAVIVLSECYRNHDAFVLIIKHLNGVSGSPPSLASLLNEMVQFRHSAYRADIAGYVLKEREKAPDNDAHLLAEWLDLYQMWSRTIT